MNDNTPVPGPDATWAEVSLYAIDGYQYDDWGGLETLGDLANTIHDQWRRHGTLPDDVHALRGALFFEQRRTKWGFPFDFNPTREWANSDSPYTQWTAYVQALLTALRGGAC